MFNYLLNLLNHHGGIMKTRLGANIKALRKKQNFTQEELGNYLGVLREQISYYENGSREVPLEHLEKLANLFGVELIELLENEENQFQANLAFAFRADEYTNTDLESLARVKKIIKNYLNMMKAENGIKK